ncbi:hypothetical protein M1M11_30945 [Pseudomonas azerbaijanoccidens]|uniref:hypothetical protein n=1 Tax=Pseudomonas azerbaijanoccidentalis TaxID=2842347 RepID=UPI00200AEB19|nr:hypothetical protein [Pseudomonas azerbaijanoccidentalis]
MLNGIGGRSIAEAKARLTYPEAISWMSYVRQTGSLNLGKRIEQGFALLATVLNRANGGSAELSDFLPIRDVEQESVVGTADDIMRLLQSVKR